MTHERVGDVPVFAEQLFAATGQAAELSWGAAPLQFKMSDQFGHILDVDDVAGWMDCSLLQHPLFRVFLGGKSVPVQRVASPRNVAGRVVTGFIDGAKTRNMFAQGATLMLCNMHEWHAPSRRLCASLTEALVAEVKATVFYSPAGCQGLGTHRDDAHVFVAQLSGEKQWSLFGLPSDPQGRTFGPADPRGLGPEEVIVLKPGDGLYLPPYLAHHARAAASSDSLHLSLAVREPLVRDVLVMAVDELLADGLGRAELSGSSAERVAQVGGLLKLVAERLAQVDAAELVASIEKRIVGR